MANPIIARDLSRLKAQLLNTGLQNKDNPLWQVINQLIDQIQALTANVFNPPATTGGTTTNITNQITQILGIPGQSGEDGETRIIMVGSGAGSTSSAGDYVVLSDGAEPIPEPVNDGFGNFIYLPYSPP